MNYKSMRWRRLRERILKRDNYECRECNRYGKTRIATTVHHIKPVEQYPKLMYDVNNLYSCCNECHNSFHDRITNELTIKGLDLIKRIYRT